MARTKQQKYRERELTKHRICYVEVSNRVTLLTEENTQQPTYQQQQKTAKRATVVVEEDTRQRDKNMTQLSPIHCNKINEINKKNQVLT